MQEDSEGIEIELKRGKSDIDYIPKEYIISENGKN